MSLKTISAKAAAALDGELMSSGSFSIDQLMELAGLAVAQAIYRQYPPTSATNEVVVLVGPGNNGGDGLVAARHLKLWGYSPAIYYPKQPAKDLYRNLLTQLKDLDIAEVASVTEVAAKMNQARVVVDALFGFSFHPPVRPPFDEVLGHLATTRAPVCSVDIPSGWDVDEGPQEHSQFTPSMLVSLTAPKPCAKLFTGEHWLGGRFINPTIAAKYGIEDVVSKYKGDEMVVKL
ncbi:NAD(P)H-hydrate epimerase [Diutina catenulata]